MEDGALNRIIRREIVKMIIHPTAGILELLNLKGAVASVALSHPETCTCDVCLAAAGDVDAFARVANDIIEGEDRDRRDERS